MMVHCRTKILFQIIISVHPSLSCASDRICEFSVPEAPPFDSATQRLGKATESIVYCDLLDVVVGYCLGAQSALIRVESR